MHSNRLKLSGALEEFSITTQFLCSKYKNQLFEESKRFEDSISELKFKWLQTRLADLKNTKHLKLMLMAIFYDFF